VNCGSAIALVTKVKLNPVCKTLVLDTSECPQGLKFRGIV